MSPELRRALDLDCAGVDATTGEAVPWAALPKVKRGDWLAEHEERGQTFKSFGRVSFASAPHAHVDCVWTVPIGAFVPGRSPDLAHIVAFAKPFLGCDVQIAPAVALKEVSRGLREGAEGQDQIDAKEAMAHLTKMTKPRHVMCTVGVTMIDLYPYADWNFVFGLANPLDATGIFSFARYDAAGRYMTAAELAEQPRTRKTRRSDSESNDAHSSALPATAARCTETDNAPVTSADERMLLQRSIVVFLHETLHLFGLKHCIYFNCMMRGSNNLSEFDSKCVYLCPVCLRKLHSSVGFDVASRFRQLATVARDIGLDDDVVAFFDMRSRWVHGPAASTGIGTAKDSAGATGVASSAATAAAGAGSG